MDARTWLRPALGWSLVVLLLVGEYALFRRYVRREVAPAYPAYWDQTSYLTCAYENYETMRTRGLGAALREGLFGGHPTSTLIHVQGSLLMGLLGPSRLSALTLNFLYFAALQVALVGALRHRGAGWPAVALALGLLLTVHTTYYAAGGLVDFRTDFGAFCLYGILLCLVLRSGVFASLPWSLACGGVAVWLGLYRHVTTVYLGLVVLTTAILLAGALVWAWRDPEARALARRRLAGLAAAAGLAAVLGGPMLWLHREGIRQYYFVWAESQKKYRAQEQNVVTTLDNWLFYPRQVLGPHGGTAFLALAAAAAAAGLLARRRPTEPAAPGLGLPLTVLAAALAVPYLVLTLNNHPAGAVGGILVPPLLLLAVLPAAARVGPRPRWQAAAFGALALVTAAAGAREHVTHLRQRRLDRGQRADNARLLALYERIGEHCVRTGCLSPRLSTTCFADIFCSNQLVILYYEQHRTLLRPQYRLGFDLFAVTDEQAVADVEQSDVVLLTEKTGDPNGYQFPVQHSLARCRDKVRAVCERDFTPLCRDGFFGQDVTVYVRRGPTAAAGAAPDADGGVARGGQGAGAAPSDGG